MPAATTVHNYGNFYVRIYTVSVPYPSDAFHTQELLNGPKVGLTISLSFFLCCSEREIKLEGRICLLEDKLRFRQHEIYLVNMLCPRIERNAYVSRHLSTLLLCTGAILFYFCDENYLSTGSVCV
jgi:hypothetical protein